MLCGRIEDILGGQACLKLPIPDVIEKAVQRYAALLVTRSPATVDVPAAAPTSAPDETLALLAEPVLAEPVPAKDFQEVDIETLQSLSNLYQASDALVKHREALEDHLFGRARDLFDLKETVTLFDLTNTYFEGDMAGNAKEKRNDCPLVTLALVQGDSGFVRRSRMFEGNESGMQDPGRNAARPRRTGWRVGHHGSRHCHQGQYCLAGDA